MHHTLAKRIELLSNVVIIISGIVFSIILLKTHIWNKPLPESTQLLRQKETQRTSNFEAVQPGKMISLPEFDATKSGQTLLLALSTTCHFCSESSMFYRRLMAQRDANTHIVAVFPQSVDVSKSYLKRLGVSVDEIRQASLDSIGVDGTPTLILVDNRGAVVDLWIGKLNGPNEQKVVDRLQQSVAQR